MYTNLVGIRSVDFTQDTDGHREYVATYRVELVREDGDEDFSTVIVGPRTVRDTPGLPVKGSFWQLGAEIDPFAYTRLDCSIKQVYGEEVCLHYDATYKFTTKPDRCQTEEVEDPTMMKPKISGAFTRYSEEAAIVYFLRYNNDAGAFAQRLVNSAQEQIRGPQAEFDKPRMTIKIEQNVNNLQMNLLRTLVNGVNEAEMWGLPVGTIRLLPTVTWEKLCWGNGYCYYKRVLEFEFDKDGFGREILDEGTKVLRGKWATDGSWTLIGSPNPLNPADYMRFQDRNGNYTKVVLDGHGKPYIPGVTPTKWWCLCREGAAFKYEATCQQASDYAFVLGSSITGPYNSASDAGTMDPIGCDPARYTTGYADAHGPFSVDCSGDGSRPGKIFCRNNPNSDFTVLGIPTTIDEFTQVGSGG